SLGSVVTGSNTPGVAATSGITSSAAQANWTANGNPAGTQYQADISTDNFTSVNASSVTANTFALFSGLNANTTYYLRASVQGSGSFASLGTAITLANPPIAAAYSGVSSSGLQANWTANGNPAGTTYLAQISTDAFTTIVASSQTTNTYAAFTGLTANTGYAGRVQAFNAGGSATGFTSLGSVNTGTNTPGIAATTGLTSNALQANWTANGNPAGTQYQADLSTDNFTSVNASSVTANTFASFNGLSANTTYYLRAGGQGSGSYANLGTAITLANPPIAAAYSGVSSSGLQANWTANGNPAGTTYLAQISTDAFTTIVASSQTTNTYAAFTGLTANT